MDDRHGHERKQPMSVDVRIRASEDTENEKLKLEVHVDRFGATDLELAVAEKLYRKAEILVENLVNEVETKTNEEPSRIITP